MKMIIAYIVGIITLILVLILLIPLHFIVEYEDFIKIYIKIFFIKFKVYSGEKKKQLYTTSSSDSVTEKKNTNSEMKYVSENLFKIFKVSKVTVKKILKHVAINKLHFHIKIGGKEASSVALRYGRLCGLIYPVFQYIYLIKSPKNYDIGVHPDFKSEKDTLILKLEIGINLFYLISNMMIYAKDLRNLVENKGD